MPKDASISKQVNPRFTEGEKVLCFHGPLIYEAKCMKVRRDADGVPEYFIHYAGWSKSWDEWMSDVRILKYNDFNLGKQRDLLAAHKSSGGGKIIVNCEMAIGSANGPEMDVAHYTRNCNQTTHLDTSIEEDIEEDDDEDSVSKAHEKNSKKRTTPPEPHVETEDYFQNKVEIKIRIPDQLNIQLVEDWLMICQRNKLCLLPAKPTVDEILSAYVQSKRWQMGNKANVAKELCDSLKEYFNTLLPSQLLYKFERKQFRRVFGICDDDTEMSAIYGSNHLLRLFVKLGSVLVYTRLNPKSILFLQFQCQNFLKFLCKNEKTYFHEGQYAEYNAAMSFDKKEAFAKKEEAEEEDANANATKSDQEAKKNFAINPSMSESNLDNIKNRMDSDGFISTQDSDSNATSDDRISKI